MPDPSKTTRLHAFIVDDEAQMRTFVSNVMVASGFTTHQFSTAQQVESALTRWAPRLIVLDLSLATSDAVEVIRSLAASRFTGRILLVSGHGASTLEEVKAIGEARGLSMLPVLQKPIRVQVLRAVLDSVRDAEAPEPSDLGLASALSNNWLELWYQPKIDLNSRLLNGAEALIRLVHPEHGVILPGAFLPPPGDPLYVPLTDFIVRRALADWTTFAERRMTSRLAINVPASVLQRPDFVTNLRNHLPRHPDFPGLIVEITEDEAIEDPDLAREIAVQLKLYNVHVSIDDFGSGYSSMARLNELPFSEIKLDRSFVLGCANDDKKREMCRAVADLARRFDIVSVAEGIENKEDLRVLVEAGYQVGQGFLFARPMRSNAFQDLLVLHSRFVAHR